MIRSTVRTLAVALACVGLVSTAYGQERRTSFPPLLKLDKTKSFKKDRANLPKLGYISGDIGSFTLDGMKGFASYRWNHELEADHHHREMTYIDTVYDRNNNPYWVYKISEQHGTHTDELWVYFAQNLATVKVPGGGTGETQVKLDEGYRIFFGHLTIEKGKQAPETGPDEHDIHLWTTDATAQPIHEEEE